ncbi:MAG: EF2563 family selenium-dependent molybdenum hydroxylase system protein [Desulfobacterales bacterium]|nr:MAG: EF2563 family selenium-dependent molybdenum hydroxylase system protein [Desulfobacterales bacterium]
MIMRTRLNQLVIGIKGAGEMASGVAWRLYMANLRKIFMLEIPEPVAVRRKVAFCEAVYDGHQTVEGVEAVKVTATEDLKRAWCAGRISVVVDPKGKLLQKQRPDVLIDAVLAKKNVGTTITDAPLVIGLGPGFAAGKDVHLVIETNRGHNLGRIITTGSAEPDTGVPGAIGGHTETRVLRAPVGGSFYARRAIGDLVERGEIVGSVAGEDVQVQIDGVLRGLIRSPRQVVRGLKLGDIDPRGNQRYCDTISDKARAIAGSVLEAILRVYNT